jgi:hypothetical protein
LRVSSCPLTMISNLSDHCHRWPITDRYLLHRKQG